MVPSRVAGAGGLAHSSSSSGIFFQGDVQSQAVVNSRLSSSYCNSANSVPGTVRPSLGPVSGDMNNVVLNGVANSGPSVGASSLVTDANSAALSGAPHMQRSASFNTESYMRLPASPMSFTSNNISLSGSSVVDGSTVGQQQGSHQDLTHMQQSQLQQGGSGATSLPNSQAGQVSLQMGPRVPGYMQDPNSLSQVQKKPRLDIKQEDVMQQQVLQQLLQRQDSMQLQGRNPQLHALFQQQQRMRQQQQFLQALPQLQRAQLQQQQQQAQIRQQMQQQGMQQVMKRPSDNGVCARRLMQYLYHQRQRPTDNTIAYWRKFVAEYYSPRAKKRWCLSMYDNVGHNAPGVFPQASVDVWQCDICSAKSGRGFEATFEVLPRLNEIKFGSGVIDELLFLDMPRESRLSSGAMVLEYCKAVQETVYEQLRVVREGLLRIIFTQDLKILSWEFCARRHEELYPRRLVAPQVNQLLQVAQKCQSTISESGSEGVSEQDLQTNSNMVLTAGRQLVKSLELQSLNDLGFSKRYVRCLQIAEVVNSMKDLIDFCRDRKVGPIEGLKTYPRHPTAAKLQLQKMQEMEQLASVQGHLPTDRNTLNKLMVLQSGINNPMSNNNHHLVSRGAALSGSPQAALALSNYQNMLMRQNSMSQNANVLHHQEASSSFTNSIQSPSRSFQGSASLLSPSPSLSVHQQPQQQQQQLQQQLLQRSLSANNMIQQPQQQLQQQMLQQLLQEMSSNNSGGQQQLPPNGQNVRNNGGGGFGTNNSSAQQPATPSNVSGNAAAPSRSNSFKAAAAASNADSSAAATNQKAADPPQNHLHLQDELPDISQEFMDNGFFNSDLDDFSWKA